MKELCLHVYCCGMVRTLKFVTTIAMPMMSGGALLSRLTFTCIVYLYSVCFDLLATTASNFKMYTLKKLCGHRLSKLSDSILFGESQVRQAVSRRFHVKGQETLEYLCKCGCHLVRHVARLLTCSSERHMAINSWSSPMKSLIFSSQARVSSASKRSVSTGAISSVVARMCT